MYKPLVALTALLAAVTALPSTLDTGMSSVAVRATCATKATQASDTDDGKKTGIILHNADSVSRSYFLIRNSCETVPEKYVTIAAGGQAFIALAAGFQGRIMRGTTAANLDGKAHILGTWMEFSWDVGTGVGWADVSLIKGCDGGVIVKSLDGTGVSTGFSTDVLTGAPSGAYETKSSGASVIKETESLTDASSINTIPRDWLAGKLGYTKAYIDDHHGNPDIRSGNGRFDITFYPGRP